MFKNLMNFWKGRDFLSQTLDEFKQMLTMSEDIYNAVCKKLIYGEDVSGLREKVYEDDDMWTKGW